MNDPNDLVYFHGTYHRFRQYNLHGPRWGFMSWRHATSNDLVHWQEELVAISYERANAGEVTAMLCAGPATVDECNIAGFGKNAMLAYYASCYLTGAKFPQRRYPGPVFRVQPSRRPNVDDVPW